MKHKKNDAFNSAQHTQSIIERRFSARREPSERTMWRPFVLYAAPRKLHFPISSAPTHTLQQSPHFPPHSGRKVLQKTGSRGGEFNSPSSNPATAVNGSDVFFCALPVFSVSMCPLSELPPPPLGLGMENAEQGKREIIFNRQQQSELCCAAKG